jgi:hypothetical protein
MATAALPAPRGSAGGSAQAEYERRCRNREERTRARYPQPGRLILALTEEPPSTRVWALPWFGQTIAGIPLAAAADWPTSLNRSCETSEG